jgi:Myosin head (motor domain)
LFYTNALQLSQGAPGRDGKSLPFNGIITTLDIICREPDPKDEKYCAALHRAHTRHARFDRTAKKDVLDKFSVKHYAGSVQYTVEGWISRNNDRVPEGFQVCYMLRVVALLSVCANFAANCMYCAIDHVVCN